MQIDEVLESANILHDNKARRVLNTAPNKQADITIDELENGVTIERLESLTVPVYQYGTQITIHGIFKNIPDDLRVHGYKSIILNGNESLGVKYVAIDGDKKNLLSKVARYAERDKRWTIHIDSQGCEAYKMFHSSNSDDDKQKTIKCYKSAPDNLYIGAKRAVSLMYGGYAVIISIGAIYKNNVWPLIMALTGIANETEYQQRIEEQAKIDKERHDKYMAEVKERQNLERQKLEIAKTTFAPPVNWTPFIGKVDKPGIYARVKSDYSGNPILRISQFAKRGSFLCVSSKDFTNMLYETWKPTKYHKAIGVTIDGWQIADSANTKPNIIKVPKTDKIEIRHNEKLNGIEVVFPSKPEANIIESLKQLGFRWSGHNGLWYNRYSDNLMQQIQALII